MADNGTFEYRKEGVGFTNGNPCMRVRVRGGWLVAHQVGDPGIYDEIAVDFVADDGRGLQMVTVGMSEEHEEHVVFAKEHGFEAAPEAMHVYVFDGVHEDVQHDHYVHIGDDSRWY